MLFCRTRGVGEVKVYGMGKNPRIFKVFMQWVFVFILYIEALQVIDFL